MINYLKPCFAKTHPLKKLSLTRSRQDFRRNVFNKKLKGQLPSTLWEKATLCESPRYSKHVCQYCLHHRYRVGTVICNSSDKYKTVDWSICRRNPIIQNVLFALSHKYTLCRLLASKSINMKNNESIYVRSYNKRSHKID